MERYKCRKCREDKPAYEFFKRFVDDNREGICKECLIQEFYGYLKEYKKDVKKSICRVCQEYDLPYDEGLVNVIIVEFKVKNYAGTNSSIFKRYMSDIECMSQYKNRHFKIDTKVKLGDGPMASLILSDNGESNSYGPKSDLDFIEEDIIRVKVNIEKASKLGDVNAHGKWLHSLREALDLKERLKCGTNKLEEKDKPIEIDGITYGVGSFVKIRIAEEFVGVISRLQNKGHFCHIELEKVYGLYNNKIYTTKCFTFDKGGATIEPFTSDMTLLAIDNKDNRVVRYQEDYLDIPPIEWDRLGRTDYNFTLMY